MGCISDWPAYLSSTGHQGQSGTRRILLLRPQARRDGRPRILPGLLRGNAREDQGKRRGNIRTWPWRASRRPSSPSSMRRTTGSCWSESTRSIPTGVCRHDRAEAGEMGATASRPDRRQACDIDRRGIRLVCGQRKAVSPIWWRLKLGWLVRTIRDRRSSSATRRYSSFSGTSVGRPWHQEILQWKDLR